MTRSLSPPSQNPQFAFWRAGKAFRAIAILTLSLLTFGASAFGSTAGNGPGQEIAKLTPELKAAFEQGRAELKHFFTPREGLGPVYASNSCIACHASFARGPIIVQKLAIVAGDGRTPLPDSSSFLPWGTSVRPFVAYPASIPVNAESGIVGNPAARGATVKVSTRFPPSLLGRGLVDAVAESEILRLEESQSKRSDAIHGTVNWVKDISGQRAIGRFGLKARVPNLLAFVADAYVSDMGLTSPIRPFDLPNPDGISNPSVPEISAATVSHVTDFITYLAVPERTGDHRIGEIVFKTIGCAVCHVPPLETDPNHPLYKLGVTRSRLYSDLLLHHMGAEASDGVIGEGADSDQWRTAPLIGLRFQNAFMHDGRAPTVEQAILDHSTDSEARAVLKRFNGLSARDRRDLLQFVQSL